MADELLQQAAEGVPVHFCAVTESQMARAAAWRKRTITYSAAAGLAGFRQAVAAAFQSWSDVCGLRFGEVPYGDPADITLTTGTIDGPSGVLAWSELPDGSDRALLQKYDAGEAFVVALNPGRGEIDFLAVAAHEIGHAIGLDHARPGTGDLLEPTYRPGRRGPQPGDVKRVLALYGPPVGASPEPDPGADVPAEMQILGRSGKVTSRWKLTRLDANVSELEE